MNKLIIRLALEKYMQYENKVARTQDICRIDYPNKFEYIEKASDILLEQFREACE